MFRSTPLLGRLLSVLVLVSFGLTPAVLRAHCDTFDGPVLIEAQKAMGTGDVTPLLKWVKPDREDAIRKAFAEAQKNRKADPKRADNAFFDILVRIHREGESAPFTGVKPAGTVLPPAIVTADKVLEEGASKALIDLLTRDLSRKVQARFDQAMEKRRTAGKSVPEGREYVAAYVEYVHFVEALSELLASEGGHHPKSECGKTAPGGCSSCGGHDK